MGGSIPTRRWLARTSCVLALTASDVAVAAVAGLSGPRVALLSIAGAAFAFGYAITPAPGKSHRDTRDLGPVLAMMGAVVAAIAVTGGIASPMLALLPAPLLVGWARAGSSREDAALATLVPVLLGVILALPAAWTAVTLDRGGFALLAAWTAVLSAWLIGWRGRLLFSSLRDTWSSLDRVRNGALFDAASRRRGFEPMATKLGHELKNPLAAIKSLIQLEQRTATDARSKRRFEVVFAETERIQTILNDYLSLDRPADAVRVEHLELAELMAEIEALLAGRAEAAGVELALRGRGGSVVADPRLLKEAIVNIVTNALEATRRGGTVELGYHVGPAGVRIIVRDTGVGMTRDVCDRLGTPFFTTRAGRTGLGCAIARSAIAQHGGTIQYESTPGAGTIATIALPCSAHALTGATP